jgi:hypothetical protein
MASTIIDNQCFFAVVIFRKTEGSESLLTMLNVSVVGTEMMLLTPMEPNIATTRNKAQEDIDSLVYFSESNSTFSTSSIGKRRHTTDTHFAVTIKISEQEHAKLQKYLVSLVNNHIPYCPTSVSMMAVPKPFQGLFMDVFSETPSSFESLTSVQAILFALRNCLDSTRSITCCLQHIQSRFVSPGRLYDTIEPYSRTCKLMPLNIAKVVRS